MKTEYIFLYIFIMFFQVISGNPNFSHLIVKNPESGILAKSIKNGIAMGWFSHDNKTYNVYFRDHKLKNSYLSKSKEANYLNLAQYNSATCLLNLINEFFRSAIDEKGDGENLEQEGEEKILIPCLLIKNVNLLIKFQKFLPDIKIEFQKICHINYCLSLKTEKELSYLLQISTLLLMFIILDNDEGDNYSKYDEDLIDKYANLISKLDLPFYLRYKFIVSFLVNEKIFHKHQKKLEKSQRYDIKLEFNSTSHQRKQKISSLLKYDKAILDYGCNEGYYIHTLRKKLPKEFNIYMFDIDKEKLKIVENKIIKNNYDNITIHSQMPDLPEPVDVILSEVIEHVELSEAEKIIADLLNQDQIKNLLVTTPNKDFNTYYELHDNQFRHSDHKWEMNKKDFENFIFDLVSKLDFKESTFNYHDQDNVFIIEKIDQKINLNISFLPIGHCVNNIYATQLVQFTKE